MGAVEGWQRVDSIYRTIGDHFLDSDDFNMESPLGFSGLIRALRKGNAGLADDNVVYCQQMTGRLAGDNEPQRGIRSGLHGAQSATSRYEVVHRRPGNYYPHAASAGAGTRWQAEVGQRCLICPAATRCARNMCEIRWKGRAVVKSPVLYRYFPEAGPLVVAEAVDRSGKSALKGSSAGTICGAA